MLGLASLKPESFLSSRLPPPHLSKPYSPAPSSLHWSRLWKLEFFPTSLAATIPLVRWKPDPSCLFSLPSDGSRIRATLKPVAEERRQLPWVNPVQKKDPIFGFSSGFDQGDSCYLIPTVVIIPTVSFKKVQIRCREGSINKRMQVRFARNGV
ncbi:hypothetical protein MRB53_021620 [Persea americana]|uniref:Uncharacterized protein n=1 Tax=Persea americana TaxID=3435 RepID=A0ACC2L4W7_PERAE|nr:hypothetical protein MRB53_021620 [Persea americana]